MAALHSALLANQSRVITGLTPTKDGSTVVIAPGTAMVKGRFYYNDAPLTLTPAAGTRKDYIVLRFTAADRDTVLAISQGTQSAFPARATSDAIYELVIATVDNSAGAFTVEDTRTDPALCGLANGLAELKAFEDHAALLGAASVIGHLRPGSFLTASQGVISAIAGSASGTLCEGNDGRLLSTTQKSALTGGSSADAQHTHPGKLDVAKTDRGTVANATRTSAQAYGSFDVNFNKTFAAAPVVVVTLQSGSNQRIQLLVGSITTTKFTVHWWDPDGAGLNPFIGCTWIAIG